MKSGIKKLLFSILSVFLVLAVFLVAFIIYLENYSKRLENSKAISVAKFDEERARAVFFSSIDYNPNLIKLNLLKSSENKTKLNILAKSYILLDVKTGSVLLEKNADEVIPPASLTKLVAIDTALNNPKFKDLSVVIKPSKSSWAEFLPEKSSYMGLGANQKLSLEELILGMSVCSGNDAALALALYSNGSVKNFAKAMNANMKKLALKNTSFVEPTGLSEYNKTTARDFAKFCMHYIKAHPKNLQKFHSVKKNTYPKEHNIILENKKQNSNFSKKAKHIVHTKKATNTLLHKIDGCDGLKTGFIYESGFNIALTAKRNGSRFLAVILGGAGNSFYKGILNRENNSIKLMDYAFDNFSTINISAYNNIEEKILVLGSKLSPETSAFMAIPASTDLSADYITVNQKYKNRIERKIIQPKILRAPIKMGQKIGRIEYRIKDTSIVLKKIPLISPVDIEEGSAWTRFIENLIF